MGRKRDILTNLGRLLKMKLIVPLWRSPHPPEYKARGVAVGLAWAMTPLVGIQMWTVFMTWLICKKVFKWPFSLPLGLAWTWVTNVFTMIPVYYIFYVTGKLMFGDFDSIGGYSALYDIIHKTFLSDIGFVEQWKEFFKLMLQDFGVAMMVGCLPWLIVSSVMGYYITLRFEQARALRRQRKLEGK